MPELPEVESVRRQLEPELSGRRVLGVWADTQRRFHAPDRLLGRRVEAVGRRGKFLLCPLDDGLELVLHLGMTGVLHFGIADAYARARITLDDGRELVFRDVRRFGGLAVVATGDYGAVPTLSSPGPEHLDAPLSRTPPPPPRARAAPRRAHALHGAIRQVLTDAIDREGTTFRDYRMVNGESGRNAKSLTACGKSGRPCPRCATPLRKTFLGGRGTTFCPSCQRH